MSQAEEPKKLPRPLQEASAEIVSSLQSMKEDLTKTKEGFRTVAKTVRPRPLVRMTGVGRRPLRDALDAARGRK